MIIVTRHGITESELDTFLRARSRSRGSPHMSHAANSASLSGIAHGR